jgi:hypothetical protein
MFERPTGLLDPDAMPNNIVPRLAWLRVDYLFWWAKQQPSPPLIQTFRIAPRRRASPRVQRLLFPHDGQKSITASLAARINAGFALARSIASALTAAFMLEQN